MATAQVVLKLDIKLSELMKRKYQIDLCCLFSIMDQVLYTSRFLNWISGVKPAEIFGKFDGKWRTDLKDRYTRVKTSKCGNINSVGGKIAGRCSQMMAMVNDDPSHIYWINYKFSNDKLPPSLEFLRPEDIEPIFDYPNHQHLPSYLERIGVVAGSSHEVLNMRKGEWIRTDNILNEDIFLND